MRQPDHEFDSDFYPKAFAEIGERKTLAGKLLISHFEGKNSIDTKQRDGWIDAYKKVWSANSLVELSKRQIYEIDAAIPENHMAGNIRNEENGGQSSDLLPSGLTKSVD